MKICFLGYVGYNSDATNVISKFYSMPKHLTNSIPYFKRIWHFSVLVSSNIRSRFTYYWSSATSSSAPINSFTARDNTLLLCSGTEKYCSQLKWHGKWMQAKFNYWNWNFSRT